MKIESKILADSINPAGDRLTTFLVTFPRIILAELNTHRAFSRNSASSRAIPFNKMIESVQNNPFIPIAWQKQHKGMQGTEYFGNPDINTIRDSWLTARDEAVISAKILSNIGVTKQLANRLLEPFMWHTVIITSNKEGLDNFFDLRCPAYEYVGEGDIEYFKSKKAFVKYHNSDPRDHQISVDDEIDWLSLNKGQAEIHMMALAETMYDNYNESVPNQLQEGEWHIPYKKEIINLYPLTMRDISDNLPGVPAIAMISSVMCARVSYTVPGNDLTEWTYMKYLDKAWELATARPLHASPFEHCAEALWDSEIYSRNFKGFKQLREILET